MKPRRAPNTAPRRLLAAAAILTALAVCPPQAAAQTFSPTASPNPLTLTIGGPGATVTVTTNPMGPLFDPITYTFIGLPPFIQTGGPQVVPAPYPDVTFNFSLGPGAAPGTYSGVLQGMSIPATVSVPFQVIVEPPPSFTASVAPNPLTLTIGGGDATATVTTVPDPGFSMPVTYTFLGLPGFISFGGPQVASAPGYPALSFPFALGGGAVPGTYSGTLRGTSGAITVDVPFTVVVVAPPPMPEFTASVGPNPLTLAIGGPGAPVTVTTSPDPGFSAPVTYTFIGLPGFVTFGGPRTATPPAYSAQSFPFVLGAGAAPGTYSGTLRGTGGAITVDVPFTVVVQAAPEPPVFSASVGPNPLDLTLGGPGAAVRVTTSPEPGFSAPITYTFVGLPGFVTFGGPRTASAPGYPPQSFPFALGAGAAPGPYAGTLRGTGGGTTVEIAFRVRVGTAPSFNVVAAPDPVALAIGGPGVPVTVTVSPEPSFSEPVGLAFEGLPAFVQTGGARTAVPPAYAPQSFPFALGPAAVPGSYAGRLEVRVRGALDRTMAVTVIVRPPVPVIERTLPATVAAGAGAQAVRLIGRNFEPGATVASDVPGVTVDAVQVLSAELARVTLSVRPDAPAGPVRLRLTNPSGGTTPVGGLVVVLPADSLAAPLAVTATVVVFPRPGSQVALDEDLYPKGLLTVTGSGAVLGSWRLDGVVFDRFAVQAVAGQPVAVESRVPIPHLGLGGHELVLEVTHPQRVESPPVEIVATVRRASRLRALATAERAIVGRRPLAFEWTLVPGATGYEVEVELPAPAPPLRREVAVPHWRPDAGERARLGTGLVRWRVRALFPGGVRGETTAWRELALLPETVEPTLRSPERDRETGRWRLSWSGGAFGAVYRVVVEPVERGEPLLTALTMSPEYLLPRGLLRPGGRYRIRVDALGPEGEELGGSAPLDFDAPDAGGAGFAGSAGGVEIERFAPVPRSVADSAQPAIEAIWSPAVAADEVLLFVDGVEVSSLAEVAPQSIRYLPLVPLEPGEHAVELQLAGRARGWSFTVPPGDAAEPPQPFLDGLFNAELSGSAPGGDRPREPEQARLALSAQLGARRPAGAVQTTADLSWHRPLESDDASTEQESESWLARAEARSGAAAAEASVGYGAPTFLAETEYLTPGLARGGAEGALGSPGRARLAYYESFDPELGNVAGGLYNVDQDLRAAAFELGGEERRFVLRALGLEVGQAATDFDAGGEGRSFGLFGRFRLGAALSLVFEGARGEFEPGEGSFETEREGDAYRLGLAGGAGTFTWGLDLRHVEQGFVNPANRGLTPGGRSDRDGVELTLGKGWSRSSLQARLQRLEGGDGFGPPATVDAVRLDWSAAVGPAFQLALGGNFAATEAEADPALLLPATERRDWGLSASATTTLGSLQLSPLASVQVQEDVDDPSSEVTSSNLGLSAYASGAGGLSLSASLTGTRVDAGPASGTTDTLVFSLQPAWEIAAASLRLQPLLNYTETVNELLGVDATTEQYLLSLSWNPPWRGSLIALEVTGDWSRSRDGFGPDGDFFERYTAVLVLRGGGEARRPRPRPSQPPGALPPPLPGRGSNEVL